MSALDVRRVRDAIADWANSDNAERPDVKPAQGDWDRADLDRALRAQGITLTPEQIATAHRVLARRSFMGGNYTLDAKAVVREVEAARQSADPGRQVRVHTHPLGEPCPPSCTHSAGDPHLTGCPRCDLSDTSVPHNGQGDCPPGSEGQGYRDA